MEFKGLKAMPHTCTTQPLCGGKTSRTHLKLRSSSCQGGLRWRGEAFLFLFGGKAWTACLLTIPRPHLFICTQDLLQLSLVTHNKMQEIGGPTVKPRMGE